MKAGCVCDRSIMSSASRLICLPTERRSGNEGTVDGPFSALLDNWQCELREKLGHTMIYARISLKIKFDTKPARTARASAVTEFSIFLSKSWRSLSVTNSI